MNSEMFWCNSCGYMFSGHCHLPDDIELGTAVAAFLFFHPDYNSGDFVKLEYTELGQGDA